MSILSKFQNALQFGRGLIGFGFGLIMFLYLMTPWSSVTILWLLSALGMMILYLTPPKIFCKNAFLKRLAMGLYCVAIIMFAYVVFEYICFFAIYPIKDTTWFIGIALFMFLCLLSGPIGLLLYKKDEPNSVKTKT